MVQASTVRVYLAETATEDQYRALREKFIADPRVASERKVSAAEALREARDRPGLSSLAGLSDTNPFPASLDVHVKLVTEVSAVAQIANGDPAVDPAYPTSYDPDVYSRLRKIAIGVGLVGGVLLLLFAFIAYAVTANSMRAVVAARREEVITLRLLGARHWMLRDPFVIEGLMTGAIAGLIAGALKRRSRRQLRKPPSATRRKLFARSAPSCFQRGTTAGRAAVAEPFLCPLRAALPFE